MDNYLVEGYIMGVYAERYGMVSRDPENGSGIAKIPLKEVEKNFREFFNLLDTLEDFAYEAYHG